MSYDEHKPTWRLAAEVRDRANGSINGRAAFEASHLGGRKSGKPLRRVELDPREVVQLLDHMDELERMAEASGERREPE